MDCWRTEVFIDTMIKKSIAKKKIHPKKKVTPAKKPSVLRKGQKCIAKMALKDRTRTRLVALSMRASNMKWDSIAEVMSVDLKELRALCAREE